MRLLRVGAGLRRAHALALVAPEGVLEEQRRDPELVDVDVVEDPLRVVGAVVVTDARVVTADDEVRAAVVSADDRVQDRLAGAGVVHLARVDAEHHVVGVVVVVHQDLVAAHPHVRRDVALLGLADQRVDEEPVRDLERGLGQVLVRPVDRVAGLEGDDPLPAALVERRLRLRGRQVAAHERLLVVGKRLGLDRPGETPIALIADRRDAGVLVVGGPVDGLRLVLDVAVEDLIDGQRAEPLAVRGRELDHVADLALEVGRQGDRDRPDLAGGEPHLVAHRAPIGGAQEARERREASVGEQLEVRGLARKVSGGRQLTASQGGGGIGRYPLMPHSVLSNPGPAAGTGTVRALADWCRCMQPIEGKP